jgi:two-component system LytT family response regulator
VSAALRVLVVDDEPLARRRIRRMLAAEPAVEVVGECGSATSAIAAVAEHAPDLVLLDIEMPGGDGFDVVGAPSPSLSSSPLVVFVTAHDEHAMRAFDAAAVDYLLKPVRRPRLRLALERARARIAERRPPPDESPEVALDDDAPISTRLLVERANHMEVVRLEEVDWIEAANNHVIVHLRGERHRYRRTLEQIFERLPPEQFARAHRSAIVNLDRVKQVHPWFHGSSLLVMADGSRIATGRQFRDALLKRLHLLR